MTGAFPLHLLFAFGSGWVVVAAVTTIADLYGSGQAGFLGGLPSTGAVSLLFIGWSQSQTAAVQATAVFPLSFSVTFAFLLFYSLPDRMTFGPRMAIALLLWLALSSVVAFLRFDDFSLSVAIAVVMASTIFVIHRRIGIRNVPPVKADFSLSRMIWRGALGGCIVCAVVILSEIGGPLLAGVFAAAPAIWTSSLYVTSDAHGVQFSRSLTNSFMVTGILTVIPYAIAVRYMYSDVGIWWGTILAYAAISPLAWLAWHLVNGRKNISTEKADFQRTHEFDKVDVSTGLHNLPDSYRALEEDIATHWKTS